MREEILEMKKQVEKIKEDSLGLELLRDYKKQNKRQFIVILVILGMWFGYLVYILNDIGTETTTQEVTDIDSVDGNIVNKGDIDGQD